MSHQDGSYSNMTGVLINRDYLDPDKYKGKTMWWAREEIAIYKQKEASEKTNSYQYLTLRFLISLILRR